MPDVPDDLRLQALNNVCGHVINWLGQTNDTARQVNAILHASDDPTGVLAWWFQTNGYLPRNTAPIHLLNTTQENDLLKLAQGVVAD